MHSWSWKKPLRQTSQRRRDSWNANGAATTIPKSSCWAWPTPLARRDPGRLRHLGPARDLFGQELGEVFRRAAFRRHDLEAEIFQALAHGRVVDRVAHRLVELAHDELRRAARQEERVPHARLDAGQALLTSRGEIADDGDAPRRHDRDALHGPLLRHRRTSLNRRTHI